MLFKRISLLLALFLIGCSSNYPSNYRIVKVFVNQNKTIDAVIFLSTREAKDGANVKIFLVPAKSHLYKTPIFVADGIQELGLSWDTRRYFVISARTGHVRKILSKVTVKNQNNKSVRVVVIATIDEPLQTFLTGEDDSSSGPQQRKLH